MFLALLPKNLNYVKCKAYLFFCCKCQASDDRRLDSELVVIQSDET